MARWKLSSKQNSVSIIIWNRAWLYLSIRRAALFHSLNLRASNSLTPKFSPNRALVGLGEAREEVMQVMDDMRSAVDFITIGQYLQPTLAALIDRFRRRKNLTGWLRKPMLKVF